MMQTSVPIGPGIYATAVSPELASRLATIAIARGWTSDGDKDAAMDSLFQVATATAQPLSQNARILLAEIAKALMRIG